MCSASPGIIWWPMKSMAWLQSPRWFTSFHLSHKAEWVHMHENSTQGRALHYILSISINKCYTIPSEVYMSANISSCLQSWGTACRGLFPWKPYFALVHNELSSLVACWVTDEKKIITWRRHLKCHQDVRLLSHTCRSFPLLIGTRRAQTSANNDQFTIYRAAASATVLSFL